MSLSEMYAAFVTTPDKERDPERLFVSDVGKCTRMAAYRMVQTEPDPTGKQEWLNKLIMFDLAEHIESTLAAALDKQGALIAYQDDVMFGDSRDNWGGRLDIVADHYGRRIIEVKTLHPNGFRYNIDYRGHQCQAAVYDLYCKHEYDLDAPPLLAYFDRGGSNTPQEHVIEYDAAYIDELMDELEGVRASLPALPPQAPHVLKERSNGLKLMYEPPGDCNYCDYKLTCQPDMSKETWGERDHIENMWRYSKKAKPMIVEQYANARIRTIMEGL